MAGYEVYFKESVWKDIRRIAKTDLTSILSRIEGLDAEPRPSSCEKLSDQELYRIRQGK